MQQDKLVLIKENNNGITPVSFDVSPTGDRIIATGSSKSGTGLGVHLFRYENGVIEHIDEVKVRPGLPAFDKPFSLRFSPDGKRVLVPNGGGEGTKGRLDAVLSIDLTVDPPVVTEVIPQVADGIESLAFHPAGHMAVIACLEEIPLVAHNAYSHLAVLDLTTKPARLLYNVDIEAVPEGIEFTPDGSQLFVQLTSANRIAMFDVEGFLLKRNPFVLRVGHAPASMALGMRFTK
jgi:DNA-binding beta-propeller fold protein YncE